MEMHLFVARFNDASEIPNTKPDVNQNYPYIGTVFAGKYTNSFMNGTMFENGEFEENVAYLCQNVRSARDERYWECRIVSKIDSADLAKLLTSLGAPQRLEENVEDGVGADEAPKAEVAESKTRKRVGASLK